MAEEKLAKPGKLVISKNLKITYSVCMFLGVLTFGLTLAKDPERAWHAYLNGFFYFVTLAVGGMFFTSLQHITKAGWSVNVRRITESFTAFLPMAAFLGVILLIGAPHLYEWLHPDIVAKDVLLSHKQSYLNQGFFWFRMFVFFTGWIVFSKIMVGRSLKQDETGDVSLTTKNVGLSIGCLMFFVFSFSLFSVDTIMSLQAHWFSTIFGVYAFSGMFQASMAVAVLLTLYLIEKGYVKGLMTIDHVHDFAKFMFAFTIFWAYIAFSQYLLIWYANLPEESFYYIMRTTEPWLYVSLFLIIFKFIVPFFALLPRWAKRTPGHLKVVCYLILVAQFVDIFWMIYPAFNESKIIFGLPEILIFAGFMGAFLYTTFRFLSKNSLVPLKDPRSEESDHHHVVY